jgi:hypothetical protein
MTEEAISSVLTAIAKSRVDKSIRAIVLSGALSRDEGTILKKKDSVKVLSDMDLIFVVKYPWDFFLLRKRIDALLENLEVPFEVSAGLEWRVNGNRTIESYEMKKKGRVLFGDPSILCLIPLSTPTQIPKWEGIRLLLNRIVELVNLLVKNEISDSGESFDPEFYYVCMKAYIACCDAFLLLQNQFAPSYKERYEKFVRLFKLSDLRPIIPDLEVKVTEAIRFKLNLGGFATSGFKTMRLWFDCRDTVFEALRYFLSAYLKIENKNLKFLLEALERRIPRGTSGFLYFLDCLVRDKKLRVSTIALKPPRLYSQIAGVYIAQALNEGKRVNFALMGLALKYLMMFENGRDLSTVTGESFVVWKKIATEICSFSAKTPDIYLKKDF